VHYLNKGDAAAHEALLSIQTQTTLDDPDRMKFQTTEFYFKSPQEMQALFKEVPQALSNTVEIASRCNLELDFTKVHLPKYDPPVGVTKDEFLAGLCQKGLEHRYKEATPQIKERLEHELKIITQTGFASYFLIVWDFIHYAKQNNIPTGPGRGSSAGSLVSFLLGITDIDPLKYGLLFERFLNPERLSLPDIDIDFCFERRQEVIHYVTQKYGRENVAQIITFGTMQARAVVRDVGRVMGMSYADVDRIAKMIPADPNITLKEAVESEPELKSLYKNDAQITKLMDTAYVLEGLTRHASIHAAGVVIADTRLTDYTPLFKSADDKISTGYSMKALEKIGLLKVDFLGLRTLTVIFQTLKIINARHAKIIEIESIPLDDARTFKLLCSAQTEGVFQLESSGMRDLLKKLCPERFEDLIALLALYRPGPMGSGMLDDFIERRHGRVAIRYDHKKLEKLLSETYGIIVYQEQIMQIASEVAGFSLNQADLLRRAMSKKIPEVMEQQRKNFVQGCIKNELAQSTANKIFDLIEYFSGYGFNRSHSAAYALISYRTAYLKAHYPVEFMTALLTSERDNTDKVVEYVNEAQRMGITVLPPDINESFSDFTVVDNKTIRFGLLAVKNVGTTAIESIVASRKTQGPFGSLDDLSKRVDLRLTNRKVLESLIKCGALDSFAMYRAQMMVALEAVLEWGGKMQRQKQSGQMTFFDNVAAPTNNNLRIKEWPEPQVLAFEKEMLGFYISGHPLARYAKQLKRFSQTSTVNLSQHKDGDPINIVGLIAKIKQTTTRAKQEKMAILKLEDLEGFVEVLVFPAAFRQVYKYILPSSVVLVKGRLNLREDTPKIVANDLLPIEKVYSLITGISINLTGIRENLFIILKERLGASKGAIPVYLHLDSPSKSRIQLVVGEELFVEPTENLIQDVESLLGEDKLSLLI
jgi:DNA polymerase-3 subunit alpha